MRVPQSTIDRYFQGDRSKYLDVVSQCKSKHVEKTKDDKGVEKIKADALTAKLDKQIEDNQ